MGAASSPSDPGVQTVCCGAAGGEKAAGACGGPPKPGTGAGAGSADVSGSVRAVTRDARSENVSVASIEPTGASGLHAAGAEGSGAHTWTEGAGASGAGGSENEVDAGGATGDACGITGSATAGSGFGRLRNSPRRLPFSSVCGA